MRGRKRSDAHRWRGRLSARHSQVVLFHQNRGGEKPYQRKPRMVLREQGDGARNLARQSYSWRTYSSITFYEDWPGKWSVAVVSPKNEILKVITFVIEKKQTP